MAKIGMTCPGRDNEKIVVKFAIGHPDFFCSDVHRLHFGQNHFHVFAFAQHGAYRGGNVGW